jgi:hypothetical protein
MELMGGPAVMRGRFFCFPGRVRADLLGGTFPPEVLNPLT